MEITHFDIDGPCLMTSPVFTDARGVFIETFRRRDIAEHIGPDIEFSQDNFSRSKKKGTLRGLHCQTPPHAQGKLVRCAQGALTDIIVDVRQGSPTYGQHISVDLSADDGRAFWVPEGFLHGFITRMENSCLAYKVTDYYAPDCDLSVRWDDPSLQIDWGLGGQFPHLSPKDEAGLDMKNWVSPFKYKRVKA